MNKGLLTLILALAACCGLLWAQGGREVWVYEDFSSGTFPPTGWSVSSNAANWSAFGGANAGGSSPELRFSWTPQFNGNT